jgi:hypothetical protein
MQKIDDSFDGTFTENIKSNAYKSQFANKKNTIVVNVSGMPFFLSQKLNTLSLNMSLKRTAGTSLLILFPV